MQLAHQHKSPQNDRRHWRWAIRLLVWMIAISVSALWTATAEASCGDYLHQPRNSGHQVHPGSRDHRSPNDGSDHGPSCRQSPGETPMIPPVVTAEPSEQWGCIASVEPTLSKPVSYLARPAEQITLPQYSTRLERPPKSRELC